MKAIRRLLSGLVLCSVVALLPACGGGGGGGSSPPPVVPPGISTFAVGGTVIGLSGTLVLQNNLGGNLSLSASGSFQFAVRADSGTAYSVTVLTQPTGQHCAVTSSTGTVVANVTSVNVTCISSLMQVGGTITGLQGVLQLRNNAGTPVQFNTDGSYSFDVAPGSMYNINVYTSSTLQTCEVANAIGTADVAVTNVNVTCEDITLLAYAGVANFDTILVSWGAANWNAGMATSFQLFEDPDGASGFNHLANVGTLPPGTLHHELRSPVYARLTARYKVRACSGSGHCIESAPVALVPATNTQFNDIITYVKAFNTNANDRFGSTGIAVSGDGGTIAIGSLFEASSATGVGGDQFDNSAAGSGAVYVYTRHFRGWQAQGYIKASNTQADDSFGTWLALSYDGSTLAVGAPGEDSDATGIDGDQSSNTRSASGAVYVFSRAGSTWSQQAYLKSPNPSVNGNFSRVAISGDGNLIAVGTIGEDSASGGIDGNPSNTGMTDSGAVFLFSRTGSTWASQAYVKAETPSLSAAFGWSLAFSHLGDTLAVGAPQESIGGACYLFSKSSSGTWTQQARVTPTVTDPSDRFGFSVDLSDTGDTLAVGALGEDGGGADLTGDPEDDTVPEAGAAYLFERSGSSWAQQLYLKQAQIASFTEFGAAVRLSGNGDLLAVSAPGDSSDGIGMMGSPNIAGPDSAGAVYVFARTGAGWGKRSFLKATHPRIFDRMGHGMAISGDGSVLAVGSPAEPSNANGLDGDENNDSAPGAGAVYIF